MLNNPPIFILACGNSGVSFCLDSEISQYVTKTNQILGEQLIMYELGRTVTPQKNIGNNNLCNKNASQAHIKNLSNDRFGVHKLINGDYQKIINKLEDILFKFDTKFNDRERKRINFFIVCNPMETAGSVFF